MAVGGLDAGTEIAAIFRPEMLFVLGVTGKGDDFADCGVVGSMRFNCALDGMATAGESGVWLLVVLWVLLSLAVFLSTLER